MCGTPCSTNFSLSFLCLQPCSSAYIRQTEVCRTLKRSQSLTRFIGVSKACFLVQTQSFFEFMARGITVPLRFQRHSQVETEAGTGRRVVAPRIGFVNRHCFAQLFGGGSVKAFLVVNPAKGIYETRHVRIRLHHLLGESHSFIEIALAVNRVEPRQVVSRERGVLILGQGLAVIVGGRV